MKSNKKKLKIICVIPARGGSKGLKNKNLRKVCDKPLIYYPLSILMLAKIKDILIIVNKGQLPQFKKLIQQYYYANVSSIY